MFTWLRRLRARIKYRHFDRDLAREIDTHRALKIDEHRRRGAARDDARDAAARDLGNVTLMREDSRGVWIAPWLQSVGQDLRYAFRSYRRQPWFTIGALAVLTLGTSLVTVGFSLTYATFLRPWLVPDPSSVALLRTAPLVRGARVSGISLPEFAYLRENSRTINLFLTERSYTETLTDGLTRLEGVSTIYVSDNYFSTLQAPLRLGRGFLPSEGDFRAPVLVAVLSERLWRSGFSADPAVIGRNVALGNRRVTIVGVAAGTSLRDGISSTYDLALPVAAKATERRLIEIAGKGRQAVDAVQPFLDASTASPTTTLGGRLADGATHAAAAAELAGLSAQFRRSHAIAPIGISLVDTRPINRPFRVDLWNAARLTLLGLFLVLAVACANVGNMLLARGLARRREIGVRLALGAGRRRIIRQLVTEAGLLAVPAATISVLISAAVPAVLSRIIVNGDRGVFEGPSFYTPTVAVYLFAAVIAALTTMICGLAPALRTTGITVSAGLDRQGPPARRVWLQRLLLSAQIATTTVLLVAAGLLTRAMSHALSSETGLKVDELQVLSFDASPRFPSIARRQEFFSQLAREVEQTGLPAAFMDRAPIVDDRWTMRVRRPGETTTQFVRTIEVLPSFFQHSGVTLTSGRAPAAETAMPELVISANVAAQLWPGADPINQILIESDKQHLVVGVASDAKLNTLEGNEPVIYRAPEYVRGVILLADQTPAAVERIRTIATAIEPHIVITTKPLRDYAIDSLQMTAVGSWIAWAISGLGLLLAIVGAIAVFGYSVEARRREIGIRLALGARPRQVVGAVLQTSQTTVLIGITAGFAASFALAPLLRSYLYGLSPFDALSYLQISGILVAAAIVASWLPARRAVRIDPIETLRVD